MVSAVVVCHHPVGLGRYIEDSDEYAHVDVPLIDPPPTAQSTWPRIGSRVRGQVVGYAEWLAQHRVVLYVPPREE